MADIIVNDQGSVVTFQPVSVAAKEWFNDNVEAEDWQWLGPVLGVDHRMAQNLLDGLVNEGFEIA